MIARVKGTQDILDLRLYRFVKNVLKKHVEKYHFTPIRTPILEPLELFKRSLGTETDVVNKEMYIVTSAHAGAENAEDSICLRPEATASTMRAYYNNHIEARPWKVYSTGSMFRHERPQKGRYREFTQTTFEVLGATSVASDVQLITMLDRLFSHELHMSNYALMINYLGCAQDRVRFKQELALFLEQHSAQLCSNCMVRKERNIMRVFDCKNESCQQLYTKAPQLVTFLCAGCASEWQQLQSMLSQLSVTFSYQPRLVRGLDYYNKTVFEFIGMSLGAQNAFCGGGRYDGLAQLLGAAQELPSVGAAIGIDRLLLLLEQQQDKLPLEPQKPLYAILPVSEDQQMIALLVADELQAAGLVVETFLEGDSMKSMMRKANKLGAVAALIIGEEEQSRREVSVKFLTNGNEEKIAQIELVKRLRA